MVSCRLRRCGQFAALLVTSFTLFGCSDGPAGAQTDFMVSTKDIGCPPTIETPNLGENSPVQDIAGIRPGMSFDQVVAILACRGDVSHIEYAPLWNVRENHGVETRQLLRASDGTPCTQAESRASPAVCEDAGGRLTPLKGFTQEFAVVFTGLPGEERAHAVWRHQSFSEDNYPITEELLTSLAEKYGPPHLDRTGHHFYISKIRSGSLPLYWNYRYPAGSITPRPADTMSAMESYRNCINGPTPWFGTRKSWNTPLFNPQSEWRAGCGLTIRAEVVPVRDNAFRTRELNVVVMNQTTLSRETQAFEARLREVGSVGGARPDL